MTTPPTFNHNTDMPLTRLLHPRGHFRGAVRWIVIGVATFIGVGALFGGYGLLSDAEGFGVEESWLEGSRFPDYTVPGLFLLVVIGGGMLATAALVAMDDPWSSLTVIAMGTILLLWLVIETATIGFRGGPQLALLAICGGSGLLLAGLGTAAWLCSPHRR